MTAFRNISTGTKFWAGALLAQFILFFIFSKIPPVIRFFEHFFEVQKQIHLKLFSWVPFSAGDLIYILLGIALFYYLLKILQKKNRKFFTVQLLKLLNLFYFFYQVFWGMLYFQQPLIEKLSAKEPTTNEIQQLAEIYLQRCIETRKSVKEDQNGVFKITDAAAIKTEIINNQHHLPAIANYKSVVAINSFKPSLYKQIISYTGIYGYYNPFTAEAQYNAQLPSSQLPFTFAHESAHQLGFAREQEANFIGYLLGVNSENVELRYSAELYVLKSLLAALSEENEAFVKEILHKYPDGMKRDRIFEMNFREKHLGILDIFFGFTNDLFLKSNQQDGSVTYSYFVDLLIRYERKTS